MKIIYDCDGVCQTKDVVNFYHDIVTMKLRLLLKMLSER